MGSEPVAGKDSLFGRVNAAFHNKLEHSRGESHTADGFVVPDDERDQSESAENKAVIRRSRRGRGDRMMVPEGVIIDGSFNSVSDTAISGRVEGDVAVEKHLRLGPTGHVCGNVRAHESQIEGTVDGKVECTEALDLGPTGSLRSEVIAGKKMVLAGNVTGNVTCGGLLRLTPTAIVTGNIRARSIVLEEGAVFNGACSTRGPQPSKTARA